MPLYVYYRAANHDEARTIALRPGGPLGRSSAAGYADAVATLWLPYDAAELARIGVPAGGAQALSGRGLPVNAHEWFVRVPERELQVAQLPGGPKGVFLARVFDDYSRTYWLSQEDASVWMRYGKDDEPSASSRQIDESVQAMQEILGAWCDFRDSDISPGDEAAYDDLVCRTIIRAVSAEPEAFTDETSWWAVTFEEVEYSLQGTLRGETPLYELVRQDESEAWVLDHPGYEDE